MSYRVRTDNFEGPFDLLLYLVSQKKVDIGSISVSDIVDQYLDYIDRMDVLDLDVASDFLLVASTLLQIKAASLTKSQDDADIPDDLEELSPNEARDVLVRRLFMYLQYRNAAASLGARYEAEGRMHPRMAGPDPEFLNAVPDYLEHVTLDDLGTLCAEMMARRDVMILESEHIAAKPIPVETKVRSFHDRIKHEKHMTFYELTADAPTVPLKVVSFLAILELYKRMMVLLDQPEPFGDIDIDYIEGSPELTDDIADEEEWQ